MRPNNEDSRKALPTVKATTSSNTVANGAPELNGCDFFAEIEMLISRNLPEGASQIDPAKPRARRPAYRG